MYEEETWDEGKHLLWQTR